MTVHAGYVRFSTCVVIRCNGAKIELVKNSLPGTLPLGPRREEVKDEC